MFESTKINFQVVRRKIILLWVLLHYNFYYRDKFWVWGFNNAHMSFSDSPLPHVITLLPLPPSAMLMLLMDGQFHICSKWSQLIHCLQWFVTLSLIWSQIAFAMLKLNILAIFFFFFWCVTVNANSELWVSNHFVFHYSTRSFNIKVPL